MNFIYTQHFGMNKGPFTPSESKREIFSGLIKQMVTNLFVENSVNVKTVRKFLRTTPRRHRVSVSIETANVSTREFVLIVVRVFSKW